MSLNEVSLRIPSEQMANVFGQFDANIKKIERALGVTVIAREDQLKIIGNEAAICGEGQCDYGAECELCIGTSGRTQRR